jgi:AcrR family transcriptional regulator
VSSTDRPDSPDVDPRRALIEAMAQSCMERGYTDTTIDGLLATTGLDRSAFEQCFADKEACGLAAVDAILAKGLAAVFNTFSGDIAEGESVLRGLLALVDLFAEQPAMASLAMTDSRQRMPRAAYERYASGFAMLIAMVDRLRADAGAGGEPPPCAALAALGGCEAVIRREIALGRAPALRRLLPDLIYSALVPFLGQGEALRIARQGRRLAASRRSQSESR